ncbi:MAG: hypothetical protein QOF76_3368 [Solirubrobacteraceae bacterium]|jgi:AcrR family transcriptional regulator|nr:hypothetical protein [Solirubrobacteraceae bacterium]
MTDLSPTRRAEDADALRPVLAAAREAFARFGVHRTRMEDIAAGADMPRQYLYRHVSSKDELIELALLERCREFSDAIAAHAASATGPLEDQFVDVLVESVIVGREDSEFAYLAEALPRARLNLLLTGSGSPMHGYVKRCLDPILGRARDAGRLRTDVSEDDMVDWIQGVMTWLTPREDLAADDMRRTLRSFALPSLLM